MQGTDFGLPADPFAVDQEAFGAWLSKFTLPYAATNAGGKRLSLLITFEPNGDEGSNTLFKVVHGDAVLYLGQNIVEAISRFNGVKGVETKAPKLPSESPTAEDRWDDTRQMRAWDDDATQIVHL